MLHWLKQVLRDQRRFLLPAPEIALPKCRIRPAVADDIGMCEEIYRLNDTGHFPSDYFGEFSVWLRSGSSLVLVAEMEGQVRAVASIATYARAEIAALIYGMVHPEFHGRRLGTALVLARLAALPEPDHRWKILISTTGGSHTFFERFGFRSAGRFCDERGTFFDSYRAHVYRSDWRKCRVALAQSPVKLETDGITIPSIPIPSMRYA